MVFIQKDLTLKSITVKVDGLGEEQFYCGKCDSFFASEVDYTVHLSQHAKPAKRKSTEEAPSFGDSHNVLNEAYDMAVASNLPG